jgi:hypothetical protein
LSTFFFILQAVVWHSFGQGASKNLALKSTKRLPEREPQKVRAVSARRKI